MHPILHVPTTCPHYTPLCEANVVAPCTYCIQYVSFVEIFTNKSIGAFEGYGFASNLANRYATFCFFGGILFTWVLGKLVHWITNLAYAWTAKKAAQDVGGATTQHAKPLTARSSSEGSVVDSAVDIEMQAPEVSPPAFISVCSDTCCDNSNNPIAGKAGDEVPADLRILLEADHHANLSRMGVLAALAVGMHNLPEGLATFIAALASPTAGIAMAVAIALHNIPEGIIVAMPIYYASGSKWKGFLWSAISGLSEVVGALLAYLVLYGNNMDPLAYAILFAFVGGMMVYISIKELLPTALRYDPNDTYVSIAFLFGMAVMAGSLLLFQV
eukprot:jgi/Chrzof1/12575/UNPLg00528.t1